MIKLQKTDAKKSLEIANDIIKNREDYNNAAIRASIQIVSNYFQDLALSESKQEAESEKSEFINFCTSIFHSATDEKLKDTTVFSLINMLDYEAVKTVINNPNIDFDLKITCISRNYKTLADVIENNPTKDDVEFIISAMEIAPIKDLAPVIEENLLSNKNFNSEKLNNIIVSIEKNGFNADKKYAEKTPNQDWIK